MSSKKKILMVMPVMKGGGAERVASLLLNEFNRNGYDCEFLLTSSKTKDIINRDLNPDIPVTSVYSCKKNNIILKILELISPLLCKPFELFGIPVPAFFAYLSFFSQYHREIKVLKEKLKKEPETKVVSFLQPSVPMTLIATKGLPNRVIISERGDPKRLFKKRYGLTSSKNTISVPMQLFFRQTTQRQFIPTTFPKKEPLYSIP